MPWHNILLFVHLMSLVFWLGTDIGVFILGKFALKPEYSVDQRSLLLKVALVLDMFPRICLVLMVPTGFQLADNLELLPKLGALMPMIWILSLVWLIAVVIGLGNQGSKIALLTRKFEKLMQFVLVTVLGGGGIYFLMTGTLVTEKWLAAKIFLYGLIAVFMMMLERAFLPAIEKFAELETKGTSSELEQKLTHAMNQTYLWVLAIYAVVIFSAFLGVVKP